MGRPLIPKRRREREVAEPRAGELERPARHDTAAPPSDGSGGSGSSTSSAEGLLPAPRLAVEFDPRPSGVTGVLDLTATFNLLAMEGDSRPLIPLDDT